MAKTPSASNAPIIINPTRKGKLFWLRCFGSIIIMLLLTVVTTATALAAGGASGGGGGSGGSGCSLLCSDLPGGAVWRWYQWPGGDGDIYINGTYDDVSPGGIISHECKNYGGYWRYGMIAIQSYTGDGGVWVQQGSQRGINHIGGNDRYRSVYFGGQMQYNLSWGGEDWYSVQNKYLTYQAYAQSRGEGYLFPYSWDGSSMLGWFCGPYNITDLDTYSAQSFVYADSLPAAGSASSASNTSAHTDIVNSNTIRQANAIDVSVGDSANIYFSHNIFHNSSKTGVNWLKHRTISYNGGWYNAINNIPTATVDGVATPVYTINGSNTAGGSSTDATSYEIWGQNDLTRYISNNLYGSSSTPWGSSNDYLTGDYYAVTFNAPGAYQFCESMQISDGASYKDYTTVCTTFNVSTPPIPPLTLYGSSTVTATSGSDVATATIPITSSFQSADANPQLATNISSSITLEFGHNLYASEERTDAKAVQSTTYRYLLLDGGSMQYALSQNSLYTISCAWSSSDNCLQYNNWNGPLALNSALTVGELNVFTGNAPYTVGSGAYMLGDKYEITFKTPGTYQFCERLDISDGLAYTPYTTVCAKIIVDDQNLYAQSAVDIRDIAAAETPRSSKTATNTANANADSLVVGEQIEVKFGHVAYSTDPLTGDDEVHVTTTRVARHEGTEYGLAELFGASNITVNNTNGSLAPSSDYGNFALNTLTTINSRNYYWHPTVQTDFDVNGVQYNWGDAYGITLTQPGTYEICEKLYLGGDYYTETCANLVVTASTTYYATSTVTATSGSSTVTATAPLTTTISSNSTELVILEGDSVSITFNHAAYANRIIDEASWRVITSGIYTGTRSSLTSLKFDTLDGTLGLYGASTPPSSMTPRSYSRTFPTAGEYSVCQTFIVDYSATHPTAKVCVKITVQPDNGAPGACRSLAPPLYTSSTTTRGYSSVLAKVKFTSDDTNDHWVSTLWAKPSDEVTWVHCYFPGAQYTANTWVSTKHGREGWGISLTANTNKLLKNATQDLYSRDWENSATVVSNISPSQTPTFCAPLAQNGGCLIYRSPNGTVLSGAIGSGAIQAVMDDYEIGQGKRTMVGGNRTGGNIDRAGHTLTEKVTMSTNSPSYAKAATNDGYHRWAYRWRCTRYRCYRVYTRHSNIYYKNARVTWSGNTTSYPRTSTAEVRIPYNYTNTATIKFEDNSSSLDPSLPASELPEDTANGGQLGIVYSGETVTVSTAEVTVNPRENSKVCESLQYANPSADCSTTATYATQVDNAQVKMIAYVSERYDGNAKTSAGNGSNSSQLCSGLIDHKGLCQIVNDMKPNEDLDSNGANDALTLNVNGRLEGVTHDGHDGAASTSSATLYDLQGTNSYNNQYFASTYNVFDADAGDYFCMAIAIYPANSGSSDNLAAKGSDSWYISAPACRIIAKKPSLQVWGGSVYSNGSAHASTATKRNVYGVYDYTPFSTTNTDFLGSWGEQSVMSLSSVTGFASGAGMGLATRSANGNSSNYVGSGSLEGGTAAKYCTYQTTLSLANYNYGSSANICPSTQATGFLGITPTMPSREALANYWLPADRTTSGTVASATGKTIDYQYAEGDIVFNDAIDVRADTTKIYYTTGSVTINNNITYTSGSLSTAGNIPKVVIYATGNINISCSVTTVDALLIAGNNASNGVVDTCYEATRDNYEQKDSGRSVQLTIRGVVIADKMILGRTYGAAAGSNPNNTNHSGQIPPNLANSAIPAEIINYDTSAILWSSYMGGAAESDTMVTTYQRELAPRY